MCVWRLARLTIYLLLILATVINAREYTEKRTADDRSWFIGSRYGRGGMERGSRHVMVSPRRDDRFLAGSRYGKRNDLLGTNPVDGQPIAVHGPDKDMDCLYTGVSDLYRCVISKEVEASGSFTTN